MSNRLVSFSMKIYSSFTDLMMENSIIMRFLYYQVHSFMLFYILDYSIRINQ